MKNACGGDGGGGGEVGASRAIDILCIKMFSI